jgi:hypothetical protein
MLIRFFQLAAAGNWPDAPPWLVLACTGKGFLTAFFFTSLNNHLSHFSCEADKSFLSICPNVCMLLNEGF